MIKVGDKVKITGDTCYHGFGVGDVVTCAKLDSGGMNMFFNGAFHSWVDHDDYTPHKPTTGTLAEIGAQVGDVVALAGREFNILDVCDDRGYLLCRSDIPDEGGRFPTSNLYQFRIVSRAQTITPNKYARHPNDVRGPVITETVKRIVPGVYGKVSIQGEWKETVGVSLVGSPIDSTHPVQILVGHVQLSRADLIAARDVFNQLIDAMPD